MSHKGKASASSTTYNPDDPPEVYNNSSIGGRINVYTETGRQIHGPEWDPSRASLDGEVIMRVGQGKKHGRYFIGDSILDTASTPTLAALRARSTSSSPPILSRPSTAQLQVDRLQVIFDLFIVTQFLHMLHFYFNIGMFHCRLGWMSKQRLTRRFQPKLRSNSSRWPSSSSRWPSRWRYSSR